MKDEDSVTENMDVELVDFDNYENKDDFVDGKHNIFIWQMIITAVW